MIPNFFKASILTAAIFAGITGCSQNEVATPDDVLLYGDANPALSEPVPASTFATPIDVQVPQVTTLTVPEQAVLQPTYIEEPQIISTSAITPTLIPVPAQPARILAPIQPIAQPVAAPIAQVQPIAPAFDCSTIPTSKAGLTLFRQNCT